MDISAIQLSALIPPKDDLLSKIISSKLRLKNGDILAISSKVVSIDEGRCLPTASHDKIALVKKEAQQFYTSPQLSRWGYFFTITQGALVGSAGIDQSNGDGYFVLWPKNPMRSAERLRKALMKKYGLKKFGVVITDSTSRPLRRGAMGMALAWAGFQPLYDYRGTKDIFGREIQVEQANLVDGLAAAAVLVMGEGAERTPLALMRDVPEKIWEGRDSKRGWSKFIVPLKDDLFEPFLNSVKWKKGGGK